MCHLSNILLIIVLDKKTFHHESWHFISVNRKIKYTIPTPHNFANVDFTIKWNIVSLQIDVMTFKINANKIIWFWNISNEFVAKLMTCQNLQNKLLNIITVLFIWYLLPSLKKMSITKHGELFFILVSTCFSPLAILVSVWKKWFPTLHLWNILSV